MLEKNTLSCCDRWIHGQRIIDLSPQVHALVSKRRANNRTVYDALSDNSWISDIQGALTVGVLLEYVVVWDIFSEMVLQPDAADTHVWCFSLNGQYSASSAYENVLQRKIVFCSWARIWKAWAPGRI